MIEEPAVIAVTTPELFMLTLLLLLLHVPVVESSANVIVEPEQTEDGPVMDATAGKGFTVIVFVESVVPHPLVMV